MFVSCLADGLADGDTLIATRLCGSGNVGTKSGTRLTSCFDGPVCVIPDPRNSNGYYLAERRRIRYFDETKDRVTVLAGRERSINEGWEWIERGEAEDGIGTAAQFDNISAITIDSCGDTIWCADQRGGVRWIEVDSGQVTTTSYHDCVYLVCWDRAAVEPDSALYCLTLGDGGEISRFDIASNAMAAPIATGGVQQFVVTPTGHIIFAAGGRVDMFVIDPSAPVSERLDQLRDVNNIADRLLLLDDTRMLLTITASGEFLTYTLPPEYFLVAKCCDRDL